MTCATPIPFASQVDYWARALPELDEQRLEDHAFGCDTCTASLAEVGTLVSGIRDVVGRRGGLRLVLSSSVVDRLTAAGSSLRHYRLQPGDAVPCAVEAADDLVVTWLAADFTAVDRVDIAIHGNGSLLGRLEDVPIDRSSGQVIFALGGDLVRTFPSMTITPTVIAVAADGAERQLASYTLEHTAFRAS